MCAALQAWQWLSSPGISLGRNPGQWNMAATSSVKAGSGTWSVAEVGAPGYHNPQLKSESPVNVFLCARDPCHRQIQCTGLVHRRQGNQRGEPGTRSGLRTTAIPAASVVTGEAAADRITFSRRVGTASTCAKEA